MKATVQYFPVVLFIMLHKVILIFESLEEILNFASTNQPGTQRYDIWARWPAKPLCHLFSFNILTKVDYNKGKLSAPKPDTKTPKNQQVEKMGSMHPRPRQGCHPLGFQGILCKTWYAH